MPAVAYLQLALLVVGHYVFRHRCRSRAPHERPAQSLLPEDKPWLDYSGTR